MIIARKIINLEINFLFQGFLRKGLSWKISIEDSEVY